jgi:hypothetical protein
MKKWIARKLFDWAVWLDWDEAVKGALAVVLVDGHMKAAFAPPKKRGRPAGRKDSVGPKKVGRPLGSKDKQPRKSSKAVTP